MDISCVNKNECCGCASCYNVCPVSAITMIEDEIEGVLYPVVDKERCIDCGACVRGCPSLNTLNPNDKMPQDDPVCYAAIANDNNIRENSSSGGIFSLLAQNILENGGVVFGAAFDDLWEVEHIKITTVEELSKLRGSKYLQSKIAFTYKEVKAELQTGKKVMFSGTPCQCEGLASYLGKKYDNLYLVDFICHGVPSPLVWRKYVELRGHNKQITSISFRNKNISWEMFLLELVFTNSSKYMQDLQHDTYMRGFLRNLYLRSSCYHCNYRKQNRITDITLADFWGVDNVIPGMNDHRGTSLVIVQSDKGADLLYHIDCKKIKCEYRDAIKYNPSYIESPVIHKNRDVFFKCMTENEDIEKIILECTRDTLYQKFRKKLSPMRRKLSKISWLKNVYHRIKKN